MAAVFDPHAVQADQVVALTGPQCRKLIEAAGLPPAPKSAKVGDLRRLAAAAWTLMESKRAAVVAETTAAPEPVEAEPERAQAVEEPGVELEPRPADHLALLPDASRWQQLVSMGEFMAQASLCPDALKDKPKDVTLILLAANDLGIPVTQALDKIYVTNGRKGMAAELMRALVRRDGHQITPDPSNDDKVATFHCVRIDNGERASISFTIDDAVKARLCSINDAGKVVSRSKNEKAQPWELYTAAMLEARATSKACRLMFSDCLAGIGYTPEELGYIDADDDPAPKGRNADAPVSVDERRSEVAARMADVRARWERLKAGAVRSQLIEAAKKANLPQIKEAAPAALTAWGRLLDEATAALDALEGDGSEGGDVEEATVIEDGGVPEGCTGRLEVTGEPGSGAVIRTIDHNGDPCPVHPAGGRVIVPPDGSDPGLSEPVSDVDASADAGEPGSGTGPQSDSHSDGVENASGEDRDAACWQCAKVWEPDDEAVMLDDGAIVHEECREAWEAAH